MAKLHHLVVGAAKNLLLVITCLCIWLIVLLPVFAIPLLMLFLIRKCTDAIVLHIHPTYKPIERGDALYAAANDINYSDKPNHCFASVFIGIVVDGQVAVEEFRQVVESTLFRDKESPNWQFWKLRSKPVKCFGYYYWKPVTITSFEDYVKECPPQFTEINQLLNEWLPLQFEGDDRSPWEVLLLRPGDGTFEGKTLIMIKSNHVILDAVGGRDFVMCALGSQIEENANPIIKQAGFWPTVYHLVTIPRMLAHTLLDMVSAGRKSPVHNNCNNGDTINIWKSIDAQKVKKAKQKQSCSFKTVLACATGSALRRHMLELGKSKKVPNHIWTVLNTHWPHAPHQGNLTINATSLFVKLNIDEGNPVKTVSNSSATIKRKMQIGGYKLIYWVSQLNHLFPSFMLANVGQTSLLNAFAITDIPFTVDIHKELHLNGKPVSGLYASVGLQGVPLLTFTGFITVGSKLCVSFASNKLFIKNPEEMEKVFHAFQEELDMMAADKDASSEGDGARLLQEP